MNNQFEKSGQEGYNQSDKNKQNQNPQAKQGQTPGQKSVVTGNEDFKKQGYGQNQSQRTGQQIQKTPGFSQYGDQGKKDLKNEPSDRKSEPVGYQSEINTPGREQYQGPQALQDQSGKEHEVPGQPEREQDLEHLRNPDKTSAPERKEIDPVASSKRDSQQDISQNPQGKDQNQNPIV